MIYNDTINWIDPVPQEKGKLSEQQQNLWRESGYAFVDGILPKEIVSLAISDLNNLYSGLFEEEQKRKKDFGGIEFPSELDSLNQIMMHQNILDIVSELLKTSDIRLSQADAWAKFYFKETSSEYDNQDQRVHVDIWNHSLVVPTNWYNPSSIAIIIYLSDVKNCGGGTAVIPKEGPNDILYQPEMLLETPGGLGEYPWMNDKERVENWMQENYPHTAKFRQALYAKEKIVKFNPGSILFYRHDIWHRGTSLTVENSMRLVINLSFRRADAEWITHWNYGWARSMYGKDQTFEKFIARASVQQRNALGFPQPGSPYWTEETIMLTQKRYRIFGFDTTPYIQAMKK